MKKKVVPKRKPFHDCASHLKTLIDTALLQKTVNDAVKAILLLDLEDSFDAIAFRGMSGSLIAPLVAIKLGKTLIGVRKGEECHSIRSVEGDLGADRYIIIDDFVSSGETVNAIRKAIAYRAEELKYQWNLDAGRLQNLGKLKYIAGRLQNLGKLKYIGVLQASRVALIKGLDGKLRVKKEKELTFIKSGDEWWKVTC